MGTVPTEATVRRGPRGQAAPARRDGHRAALATAMLVAAPLLLVVGRGLMLTPAARGLTGLWTASHLLFLIGTVLMIPVVVGLDGRSRAHATPWLRDVGLVLAFTGTCALAGQFVADLVVARLAGEPSAAGVLFDRLRAAPLVDAALYTVGPALLFTGLTAQAAALTRVPATPRWAAFGIVAGCLTVGAGRVTGDVRVEMAGLVLLAAGMAAVAMLVRHEPGEL